MSIQSVTFTIEEIHIAVDRLYALRAQCSIYTFSGPLGAGKTTLIKALLKTFGVSELVTSPTFTYYNKYENAQGQCIYHFDLYRITDINDFLKAGFHELLHEKNSLTFIEWPEIIKPLLTKHVCTVTINCQKKPYERTLYYSLLQ